MSTRYSVVVCVVMNRTDQATLTQSSIYVLFCFLWKVFELNETYQQVFHLLRVVADLILQVSHLPAPFCRHTRFNKNNQVYACTSLWMSLQESESERERVWKMIGKWENQVHHMYTLPRLTCRFDCCAVFFTKQPPQYLPPSWWRRLCKFGKCVWHWADCILLYPVMER